MNILLLGGSGFLSGTMARCGLREGYQVWAVSREFYRIIAVLLDVQIAIEEIAITGHLREHPDHQSFCAHRVYAADKAISHGLKLPATSLRQGLQWHVRALLESSEATPIQT